MYVESGAKGIWRKRERCRFGGKRCRDCEGRKGRGVRTTTNCKNAHRWRVASAIKTCKWNIITHKRSVICRPSPFGQRFRANNRGIYAAAILWQRTRATTKGWRRRRCRRRYLTAAVTVLLERFTRASLLITYKRGNGDKQLDKTTPPPHSGPPPLRPCCDKSATSFLWYYFYLFFFRPSAARHTNVWITIARKIHVVAHKGRK